MYKIAESESKYASDVSSKHFFSVIMNHFYNTKMQREYSHCMLPSVKHNYKAQIINVSASPVLNYHTDSLVGTGCY